MSEPKDSGTSVCNHPKDGIILGLCGPYCGACSFYVGPEYSSFAKPFTRTSPVDCGEFEEAWWHSVHSALVTRDHFALLELTTFPRTAAPKDSGTSAAIYGAYLDGVEKMRAGQAATPMVDWDAVRAGERAVSAVMVMLIGQSEDEAAVAYDQVKEGVHCVRRREWIANAQRLIDRGEVAAWWCQLPREAREAFVKHALERQREYDEGCGSDPA